MKTASNSSNKDNVAISAILAVCLFVLASGVFSGDADAQQTVAIQKLETIVVTASRAPAVTLETMVVTASRNIGHA